MENYVFKTSFPLPRGTPPLKVFVNEIVWPIPQDKCLKLLLAIYECIKIAVSFVLIVLYRMVFKCEICCYLSMVGKKNMIVSKYTQWMDKSLPVVCNTWMHVAWYWQWQWQSNLLFHSLLCTLTVMVVQLSKPPRRRWWHRQQHIIQSMAKYRENIANKLNSSPVFTVSLLGVCEVNAVWTCRTME